MLGSFAEFERQMMRERTKLGLARARLESRIGGNRSSLTPKQQAHPLAMIDEGKSQSEIAALFNVQAGERASRPRASLTFCSLPTL
jgi:DNA invertase Pin-like site-specific DNA recombinase